MNKTIKSFENSDVNLRLEKENNAHSTRFTKYYVIQNNSVVMTAFYFDKVNNYFDFLLEESLEKKHAQIN